MSLIRIILDLTCESLGCDKNPCPYEKNKNKCPKLIECDALCDILCSMPEDDEEEE